MAKFTRYDPRNKKNGKHKQLHGMKDIKIRDVDDINKALRKVKIEEKELNE
jgi:hypothetical protein